MDPECEMTRYEGPDWEWADFLVPFAVFAVFVFVKLMLVVSATVGPSISDEVNYWNFARELAGGAAYEGVKHPPGYPIAIAPAFLLPWDPYRTALVLNAVYSSALAFPVFWISRLVMGRVPSLVVAIITMLVPYHYVITRSLISESVYFPLLVTALFMALWRPQRNAWIWDGATGVVLAMLYLTRYMSLPLIPALALVWWMRERQYTGRWRLTRASWARAALMVVAGGLTFAPWLIAQSAQGTGVAHALGFVITSLTDPAQLTAGRLWIYARMYLAYFALIAAPVLGLVFLAVWQAWRARAVTAYTRVVAAVGLVSLALFIALTRHSWRAAYNYPEPLRIMGRYAIYLVCLFVIVAFAAFLRARAERSGIGGPSWQGLFAGGVALPLTLVGLSYWAVLGDAVMPFTAASVTDRGSVDAYRIMLMGQWFWVVVPVILVLTAVLIARTRDVSDSVAVWLLGGALAVYSVVGVPEYLARMDRHQVAARHAVEIMRFYDALSADRVVHVVMTPELNDDSRMIPASARITYRMFRDGRDLVVSYRGPGGSFAYPPDIDLDAADPYGFEVVVADTLPADSPPRARWEINGVGYALIDRIPPR